MSESSVLPTLKYRIIRRTVINDLGAFPILALHLVEFDEAGNPISRCEHGIISTTDGKYGILASLDTAVVDIRDAEILDDLPIRGISKTDVLEKNVSMTRVKFEQTGLENGYDQIVEMSCVPREGESICFGHDGPVMDIRAVIWIIGGGDYDVLVRFR